MRVLVGERGGRSGAPVAIRREQGDLAGDARRQPQRQHQETRGGAGGFCKGITFGNLINETFPNLSFEVVSAMTNYDKYGERVA